MRGAHGLRDVAAARDQADGAGGIGDEAGQVDAGRGIQRDAAGRLDRAAVCLGDAAGLRRERRVGAAEQAGQRDPGIVDQRGVAGAAVEHRHSRDGVGRIGEHGASGCGDRQDGCGNRAARFADGRAGERYDAGGQRSRRTGHTDGDRAV